MSSIADNIKSVQQRISKAAQRAGRSENSVKLVAVTKTVDTDRINEAVAAGAKLLGENRVQEILEKFDGINPSAKLHLIGHLQTNKVKYIIDKVDLIHSVDSTALADEIEKRAAGIGKVQDILIQVNVSGEESKFGVTPSESTELCRHIGNLEHVRVKGLMTVAPLAADEAELRKIFSELKALSQKLNENNFDNIEMNELSMGMTGDFEIAVEEGATMVRVGSGIFGKRI